MHFSQNFTFSSYTNFKKTVVLGLTALMTFGTFSNQVFGQTPLPNYLTEEEKSSSVPTIDDIDFEYIITPPPFDVRTPAEWEEATHLVIAWTSYWSILREIVRAAVEEVEVIIVADNFPQVTNYLEAGNVDMTNVSFIDEDFNSIWIRDYGQWSVYENDVDSLHLVDWRYNRPRPDDDNIPLAIADLMGLDVYQTLSPPNDMVNTGGNFMVDGLGTAFSSDLVLDENDGSGPSNIYYPTHTEEEIDEIMANYMGINRYIKMESLPFDLIHHIDMHMKLLDEETILMAEYPPGVADGPQIEENIQYIQDNFLSAFGTPYEFVRIPSPPEGNSYPDQGGDYRTFTNSLFINKTVIVPVYGSSYQEEALQLYRDQLPGYNIVGIDCNDIIPASGALHCITKLIHSPDPLWIVHKHLENQTDTIATEGYPLEVLIRHRSDIAEASINYRTDTSQAFQQVPLSLVDSISNIWNAAIPFQTDSTIVQYYVEATSISGKTRTRPVTAPEGYWEFVANSVFIPIDTMAMDTTMMDTMAMDTTMMDTMTMDTTILGVFSLLAEEINAITLYPNPVKEVLTVIFDKENRATGVVRIFDIQGQEKMHLNKNIEEQKLEIVLPELSVGIYYLEFIDQANNKTVRKFVVE